MPIVIIFFFLVSGGGGGDGGGGIIFAWSVQQKGNAPSAYYSATLT